MTGARPRSKSFSRAVRLTLVVGVVLISGCVSGAFDSEQPPQRVYVISSLPAATGNTATLPVDLAVSRPQARPGLDTDRIAVLYSDHRLDYYAGSRWGAEAQIVVQDLLVQSLRNSAGVRTVQGDLSPFNAEYVLQTDLEDFQAEYSSAGANPVVRVTLICTLGNSKQRRVIANYTAAATVPAAGNTLSVVIEAFETAYQKAAATVVTETLAALTAASATPSAADSSR